MKSPIFEFSGEAVDLSKVERVSRLSPRGENSPSPQYYLIYFLSGKELQVRDTSEDLGGFPCIPRKNFLKAWHEYYTSCPVGSGST
jgi:hypothetical protein